MKNHPVNNDYVQNLVEGLLNEECSQPLSIYESKARMRRQLASKNITAAEKAAIRKKLDVKEEDSEGREEETQAHLNATEAEDGGSGVASDIEHGRWQPDIKDAGGSRQPRKVRGAKTPRPFKNTAGRILKKKIVENPASTHDRIMTKLKSAGGGKEYARKKAEVKAKVADKERDRLAAAPALASIQK